MKKFSLLSMMALICIFITGCYQSETIVNLLPNGTGTVQETFLMKSAVVKQFEEMNKAQNKDKKQPAFSVLDIKKLKQKAAESGLIYVSAVKKKTKDFEGYTANYTFRDINKVKLNQNPGESISSSGGSSQKKENILFKFTKDKVSELIVNFPVQTNKPAQTSEQPKETGTNELKQMKQIFDGMRISIKLNIQGKIQETDATHIDKSMITLMEMDFNKLLADPEKFKQFAKENPKTLEETKKFMQSLPGIKVNTKDIITVKFK